MVQSREQQVPKPQQIESHNDSFSLKIFHFYKDNTIIFNLNKSINFFKNAQFFMQKKSQDQTSA
ncbi:hypothetical protein HMPREF9425_1749 [Streptococcus vestibularis ATCC 49124]|uniref:Uncharacterized protein n=1 Tax=Streptococcus vestibularis ATCC 49124 TaxID=889206 RepID=A0ABN0CER9_STRVE|nr:hypothetical protein HMPREF9425_1749 [Streptococcus vestibularis ATCC 49124]